MNAGGDAVASPSPYAAELHSAVTAAVATISEAVASLPLGVFRLDAAGDREEARFHPVARLFAGHANEWQSGFELVELLTSWALLWGYGAAEIIRDARGAVTALNPIHPSHMTTERLASGRLRFRVSDPAGGPTRILLQDELFIIRDRVDGADGLFTGRSRLSRAREAVANALQAERYAGAVFSNGAAIGGVLEHPGELGGDAAARIRADFDSFVGTGAAGRTIVLEEDMHFKPIAAKPDEAQALESRRFSVEAIARIFRIPPVLLGDLTNANYSNSVELARQFATFTLRPWLTRWERTIELSLFSEATRSQFVAEFDTDLLVRTNILERWQAYRLMRETGGASANEIRRWENIPRRTDPEGDAYFSPANMQGEQTGRPRGDRGEASP
jgi:HK97 family phage portal protein